MGVTSAVTPCYTDECDSPLHVPSVKLPVTADLFIHGAEQVLCAAHSFSYSAQMHCSGCGAEAGVGRARWLDVRQRASPPGDAARDRLAGRQGPRSDATPSAGAAGRWEHRACPRSPRRAFSRRSMGCFSRPSVASVLRCRKERL